MNYSLSHYYNYSIIHISCNRVFEFSIFITILRYQTDLHVQNYDFDKYLIQ
jgi:hypothetical protein